MNIGLRSLLLCGLLVAAGAVADEPIDALRARADAGDAAAQFDYGAQLAGASAVSADRAAALSWIRRAAESGHAPAQFALATWSQQGEPRIGIEPDAAEALRWFSQAAGQGWFEAQLAMAMSFVDGTFTDVDPLQARSWFARAAAQGDAAFQHAFARMLADGEGVPQSEPEAVQWFRRAADRGHAPAQRELGARYLSGRGVAADAEEAFFWLMLGSADDALSADLLLQARQRLNDLQVERVRLRYEAWQVR